jgi:transposase
LQKNGVRVIKDIDVFVSLDIAEELCHKHYGKRLIITDQFSWTTKEILEAYWDQSKIENIFRDSKNRHHFSIQPPVSLDRLQGQGTYFLLLDWIVAYLYITERIV